MLMSDDVGDTDVWSDQSFNTNHQLGPEPKYYKKPILCGDLTKKARREYHKSLFMPDRDRLIGKDHSLIDQFHKEKGKWRTPGVQRKINLLCYGPPGTGKSKLVRTLANHLERHVVSFKLGQIESGSQLTAVLDELKHISNEHPEHPDIRWSLILVVYSSVLFRSLPVFSRPAHYLPARYLPAHYLPAHCRPVLTHTVPQISRCAVCDGGD